MGIKSEGRKEKDGRKEWKEKEGQITVIKSSPADNKASESVLKLINYL